VEEKVYWGIVYWETGRLVGEWGYKGESDFAAGTPLVIRLCLAARSLLAGPRDRVEMARGVLVVDGGI